MPTYMYISRHCTGAWTNAVSKVPELDELLVLAELVPEDCTVRILHSAAPELVDVDTYLLVTRFFDECTYDVIRATLVDGLKPKLLAMFDNVGVLDWKDLHAAFDDTFFWEDAISALVREGYITYGENPGERFGYKKRVTPIVPTCVTPNGRTDGHGSYVSKGLCAFCGRA